MTWSLYSRHTESQLTWSFYSRHTESQSKIHTIHNMTWSFHSWHKQIGNQQYTRSTTLLDLSTTAQVFGPAKKESNRYTAQVSSPTKKESNPYTAQVSSPAKKESNRYTGDHSMYRWSLTLKRPWNKVTLYYLPINGNSRIFKFFNQSRTLLKDCKTFKAVMKER